MTRLASSEVPVVDGPQLAALLAMMKSDEIEFPDTVSEIPPIDASARVVPPVPTMALCSALAVRATVPPVALLGMSPDGSAACAIPPEMDRVPVAARIVVPVADTV